MKESTHEAEETERRKEKNQRTDGVREKRIIEKHEYIYQENRHDINSKYGKNKRKIKISPDVKTEMKERMEKFTDMSRVGIPQNFAIVRPAIGFSSVCMR